MKNLTNCMKKNSKNFSKEYICVCVRVILEKLKKVGQF